MAEMSAAEIREFLEHGTRTAKLATTRRDGRPHVAPVWFVLDGDDIIFNTGAETVKGKSLAREQRAALCVDDDRPPFSFVIVEGTVALSEDPDELVHWATRIGGRYMGEDRAEAFGRRNGVPGELLVRLTPTRVFGESGVAD
jgi:PPOX class probable F420-dependent enzyme